MWTTGGYENWIDQMGYVKASRVVPCQNRSSARVPGNNDTNWTQNEAESMSAYIPRVTKRVTGSRARPIDTTWPATGQTADWVTRRCQQGCNARLQGLSPVEGHFKSASLEIYQEPQVIP